MKSTVLFLLSIIFLDQCGVQGTLIIRNQRCSCINTRRGMIHHRSLVDLKQFAPSPNCNKTEIIATLKNGIQTCLNPDSANVKKLMKEWEKQVSQKKKQKRGKKTQKNKKPRKTKKPQGPRSKKTP
ncbi:C-X-C motif chemokine 9 [Peromyscus maniculatus bairdii]|uniref:C-X-C motif chemokine n=1 Tax=Peromyscus maniculatus bairdii TaxID=230844 RepID=A0A6I9LZV5_PERMB|nr:C-X-C motif chemokine 9 [Peromyscus maniculatus bairdii]XP_042113573.1 C-X-C motif chemokine 9 [Peromyscus maniculatus bairdii]